MYAGPHQALPLGGGAMEEACCPGLVVRGATGPLAVPELADASVGG